MGDRVRVWCLRHGESENVIGGVAGLVPSATLTARGREQAVSAGRRLALASEPVSRVYASTAVRARETAEYVAGEYVVATERGGEGERPGRHVPVMQIADLAEFGIGRAEGSADRTVRRQTADVLRSWVVDQDLDQRVDDGETGHEVIARMSSAFERIAAAHAGETVALVGHVGSLTVALSRLCGLGAAVWGTPLPHAEPFLIEWDGHRWQCPAWPVAAR